jgi:hypothetical protein
MTRFVTTTLIALAVIGCSEREDPGGANQRSMIVSTRTKAEKVVRNSSYFDSVKKRVDDARNVRLVHEKASPKTNIFWVYEDRATHAATLARLKVTHDGEILKLMAVNGNWKPVQ